MDTKLRFVVALFASHVLALSFIGLSHASVERENENSAAAPNYPQSLWYLGTADEKQYFAEVNQTMNRTSASAYCYDLGLKLATIESQAQVDLLNGSFHQNGLHGQEYWTNAKETRNYTNFIWNNLDEQPLNRSLFTHWGYPSIEYWCVVFFPYHSGSTGLIMRSCSELKRPLCHT